MHGRVEACRSRTCTAAFCSRRLFRCRDTLPQNKKPRAAKKERASRDESEGEADKLENAERFTSSLETNIILQVCSFPKVPSDVRSLLVKLDVQRSFLCSVDFILGLQLRCKKKKKNTLDTLFISWSGVKTLLDSNNLYTIFSILMRKTSNKRQRYRPRAPRSTNN